MTIGYYQKVCMTECALCTDLHCQNLLTTNSSRVTENMLQGSVCSGLGEGLLVLNWVRNQIGFYGERSGAVFKINRNKKSRF